MPSRRHIVLAWEAVQERLGKAHKPVDVSEVRDQAERDPNCSATLHAQVGEKLIPFRLFLALEEFRQPCVRFALENPQQAFFREVESGFTRARIAEAART